MKYGGGQTPVTLLLPTLDVRKVLAMKIGVIIGLVSLCFPSFCFAQKCSKANNSTLAINDCLVDKIDASEKELSLYIAESKLHFSDRPKLIEQLDIAQSAWVQYRKAHCASVYEMWAEGTIKDTMHHKCWLTVTKLRTHEIWKTYLTFMDSTPPLLSEPINDEM